MNIEVKDNIVFIDGEEYIKKSNTFIEKGRLVVGIKNGSKAYGKLEKSSDPITISQFVCSLKVDNVYPIIRRWYEFNSTEKLQFSKIINRGSVRNIFEKAIELSVYEEYL